MTKVHICITARENYLRWACLCIDSLIRRGGVRPSEVIVSIHEMLLGTRAAGLLQSYGVSLRIYRHGETPWAKFVLLDRLFREHPEVTEVVQMDCDIVLTEPMDFLSRVSGLHPTATLLSYSAPNCPPLQTFHGRGPLYLPGYSPTGDAVCRGRLDSLLQVAAGTTLGSFERVLPELPWVYGGVIVVRRPALGGATWRAMVSLAWVCTCDETALVLGLHRARLLPPDGFRWAPIPQEALAHRVNPPVLSLTEGPGMVHFAGDWYRVKHEANRALLDAAFDAL